MSLLIGRRHGWAEERPNQAVGKTGAEGNGV